MCIRTIEELQEDTREKHQQNIKLIRVLYLGVVYLNLGVDYLNF